MQTFKWGQKALRDPAQGIFCGLEFDLMWRQGKIKDGETVAIEMLPGVFKGQEALFTRRFWNAVITAPNGDVMLDYSGNPKYPFNESDPFWQGMGLPTTYIGSDGVKRNLLRYSATYGGKGGMLLGEGMTKIIGGAHRIRISGDTAGTVYGNVTGILLNWPGGKLWLENCDIDRNDDGVRSDLIWYYEKDCNFELNGSGDGQSHAKYINADVAFVDGGNSFNTRVGHNGKWLTNLLVLRNHRNNNSAAQNGDSYDHDVNGGLVYIIGGEITDVEGDSNEYHMVMHNTIRRPLGPHGVYAFGVKQKSLLNTAGDFIAIDNTAKVFTDYATYDYHKAPLLLDASGNPVPMPVEAMIDGCDGQYAATKANYKKKNWNVNKPGINVLQDVLSNNRLVQADDPAAAQAYAHVDWEKVRQCGKIGTMLADLRDHPVTPELLDALVTEVHAEMDQWSYPVGATPAPQEDPAMIAELQAQVADLTAQINTLTTQAAADVKVAQDALVANQAVLTALIAAIQAAVAAAQPG